eukprot:4171414-Pleurochrysis_carterae.AAC.1
MMIEQWIFQARAVRARAECCAPASRSSARACRLPENTFLERCEGRWRQANLWLARSFAKFQPVHLSEFSTW